MNHPDRSIKADNRPIDVLKKILNKYHLIWGLPLYYLILSLIICYFKGTELSEFFSKIPDYLVEGLFTGSALHWICKLIPTSKKPKGAKHMNHPNRGIKADNRPIDILKKIFDKYYVFWFAPLFYSTALFFRCYFKGTELSVCFSKIPDYLLEGLFLGSILYRIAKLIPTSKKPKGVDSKKGD